MANLGGIYTAIGLGQGLGNAPQAYAQGQAQGLNMSNALTQRQMMLQQIKKAEELAQLGNEVFDSRSSLFGGDSSAADEAQPTTTPTTASIAPVVPVTPAPVQTGLSAPLVSPASTTITPSSTQPTGMNTAVPAAVPLDDEDKMLVSPEPAPIAKDDVRNRTLRRPDGFISFISDWGPLSDTNIGKNYRNNFGNTKHGDLTNNFSLGPDPKARDGAEGMALFESLEDSEKAMHDLWSSNRYNQYGIADSIRKMYNPSFAKGNTPEGVAKYIRDIQSATGIDLQNVKYNDLSPKEKAIFRAATADREHGTGGFYLKQTLSNISKGNLENVDTEPTSTLPTARTPDELLGEPQPNPAVPNSPILTSQKIQPINPLERFNPSSVVASPSVINALNNPITTTPVNNAPIATPMGSATQTPAAVPAPVATTPTVNTYGYAIQPMPKGTIRLTAPDKDSIEIDTKTTPETATPEQLTWFRQHPDHGYEPFKAYSQQFISQPVQSQTALGAAPADTTATAPVAGGMSGEPVAPQAATEPVAEAKPTEGTDKNAATQEKKTPSRVSQNLSDYRTKVIAYQRKAMELYALTRDPQYNAMANQSEENLLSAFQFAATKAFHSGNSKSLSDAFSAMYGGDSPDIRLEKLSDGTYGAGLYDDKNRKIMELHASQIYNLGNPAVLGQLEQSFSTKRASIELQAIAKANQIKQAARGRSQANAFAIGTDPSTGETTALNNQFEVDEWAAAYGNGSIAINQRAVESAARAKNLMTKNSLWVSVDGSPLSEERAKQLSDIFTEINKNPSAYTKDGRPYTMGELIAAIQAKFGIIFQGKLENTGSITEMTFDDKTGAIVTRKTNTN